MADTKDTIPKKRKRREQEEKDGSNGPKKKSKSSNRTRMKESEKLDLLEADRSQMSLSDLLTKTRGGNLTKAQEKKEEERARKKAEKERKKLKDEEALEDRDLPDNIFDGFDFDEILSRVEPAPRDNTTANAQREADPFDDEIDFSDLGRESFAPKVRVTATGNIVTDDSSMRIVEKQATRTLIQDDGSLGVGYGKAAKPDKWTEAETDLFYNLIRQIGTDFTLMQFFFPNRNRGQIKTKFKREERVNPKRITKALTSSIPFDVTKFEEVSGIKLPDNINDPNYEDEARTRELKAGEDVEFEPREDFLTRGDVDLFGDIDGEMAPREVWRPRSEVPIDVPQAEEVLEEVLEEEIPEAEEEEADVIGAFGLNSDEEFDFGL